MSLENKNVCNGNSVFNKCRPRRVVQSFPIDQTTCGEFKVIMKYIWSQIITIRVKKIINVMNLRLI